MFTLNGQLGKDSKVKMFSWFILVIFFGFIQGHSIMDYYMEPPDENVIIRATLTDSKTLEKWQITELLATRSQVHGKISVTTPSSSQVDIFYHSNRDDYRIVIYENECELTHFDSTSWSTFLPDATNELVNMVLTLGPSLIYRFDYYSFIWKEESADEIRGIKVQSFSTTIASKLNVTFYFIKTGIDLISGLSEPVHVVLEQIDSTPNEKVILDIYSLTYTDDRLDELVEITPGIGCPLYFQTNGPLPSVESSVEQVYLTMTEASYVRDLSNQGLLEQNKIEIYADLDMNILRVNKHVYGSPPTEALYDYDLATGYFFDSKLGSCKPVYLDLSTPGINKKGMFDLNELFWIQDGVGARYLGNIYLPDEWPFTVDCWESIQYNVMISGVTIDKIVTTYYYATPVDSYGMMIYQEQSRPVGVIKNSYNKDTFGKFILIESQRRYFHEFELNIPEEKYEGSFQINDCNDSWDQRKTLALYIKPNEETSLEFAEKNVNELREELKILLVNEMYLSPLRIVDVDILFTDDNRITALIEFNETPKLQESLKKEEARLDLRFIRNESYACSTDDAENCLAFLASNTENKAIIFSDQFKICIGVRDLTLLTDKAHETGTDSATIFYILFSNLNHIRKQLPLDDIYSTLSNKLTSLRLNLIEQVSSGTIKYTYTFQDIKDVTMDIKETVNKQAFTLAKEGAKLNREISSGLIIPVQVNSFSDCYRACENSVQLECSLFSYCYSDDSNECLVATDLNINSDQAIVDDKFCSVNRKNLLLNYKKISSRCFANLADSGQFQESVEDCASQCYSSNSCHSFQYCANQMCYFAGNQNEIKSNISSECDIYMPPVSHQFKLTGSQLVGNIIHTEVDLTMDQCASFCYQWDSMNENSLPSACKSFNFCSQGEANLCQLTEYTIQDRNVELINSDGCLNYERIDFILNPNGKQSNEKASSVSKSESFVLVAFLIVIGLMFGLISPFAYKKFKSKFESNAVPLQRLT